MPRPTAVSTFFDTARNEHMPRKKARARFSMKTALKAELEIVLEHLLLASAGRASRFAGPDQDADDEERAGREHHEPVGTYQPPSVTSGST